MAANEAMTLPPRAPLSSPSQGMNFNRGSVSPSISMRQASPPPVIPGARPSRPSTSPLIGELPPPVAPITSARQTTPIKAGGSRTSTPTGKEGRVYTQARPSSAGRAGLDLNRATFAAQRPFTHKNQNRCASAQTSTRKLRRWERDHPGLPLTAGDDSLETLIADGKLDMTHVALKVDWRSMFSKLFQQANWSSMLEFISCAESKASKGVGRVGTSARRLRRDEWAAAETAWLLVEKKLRVAVQDTLSIKPDVMFPYVQALEAVLMFFSEKLEAVPAHVTPPALGDLLAEPVTMVRQTKPVSKAQKEVYKDAASVGDSVPALALAPAARCSLRFHIKDCPDAAFFRLFLHATSQFYGFKSKSINEKGARITIVTAPAKITSSKTPMIAARVSLAGFLSTLEAEQVAHKEACAASSEGTEVNDRE